MLFAAIIFILLAVVFVILSKPRPFEFEPQDTLLCVAHPDDCVIAGAEYAVGVVRAGKEVRIAYLTCGAEAPGSDMAATRRAEARSAWQSLGVAPDRLTFIGLPESTIEDGPANQSPEELKQAELVFTNLIVELTPNASIVIPARGEFHVDHQTTRAVALKAIAASGRNDLLVLEVPEYNNFVSFRQAPERALRTILRSVPMGSRLIRPYVGRAHYVDGGPGYAFVHDASRLQEKRRLLGHFASQNEQSLLGHFGYATVYRPANLASTDEPAALRGLRVNEHICDWTVMVVYAALFALVLRMAFLLAEATKDMFAVLEVVAAAAVLMSVAYVGRVRRGRATLMTALFVWSGALGLVVGVFSDS